jgi:hypothetical protein
MINPSFLASFIKLFHDTPSIKSKIFGGKSVEEVFTNLQYVDQLFDIINHIDKLKEMFKDPIFSLYFRDSILTMSCNEIFTAFDYVQKGAISRYLSTRLATKGKEPGEIVKCWIAYKGNFMLIVDLQLILKIHNSLTESERIEFVNGVKNIDDEELSEYLKR